MQCAEIMSGDVPSQKKQEVSRDEIVSVILSIRVGPGQPLRQVQVPPEVYQSAKKFVTTAPNFLGGSDPYRFKVLCRMSSGRSIYELLIADAANISLNDAEAKISGWQEASKALLRYALNLLLAPKRPEFQRLKLSSSYYVYQVAKKLKGAEEILVSMGYQRVSGSQEVQELKYMEDVNNLLVADTAADLVILDGELTRVKGLVTFARNENHAISLIHILQARSHRTETFEHTIHTAARLATHGSFQTPIVPQQSAVSGSPAYHNPQSKEYHNPRSKQQPHLQLVAQEPQHKSMQHDQPRLEPANTGYRRGSAPGILDDLPRDINQVGSWPILEEQDREGGNHYFNVPLDPDVEIAMRRRQADEEAEQQQIPNTSSSGLYVNVSQSSSERQRDDYSEVRFDRGGKVHVGGARTSIPPDPDNLPEPIVQDEAELARLQATNPGGDYHTVSLITDARSDPVGFGGPSFDSIISFRSPEHASQYNQDAEDAWEIVPDPPKPPSAGSNGSWRSNHSNTNTSGSEDIYGSENNSAHGSKAPSMESHKQVVRPENIVHDRRQHVTVPENKVPVNKRSKTYDSDYEDDDVVEQNVSGNTRVNYDHQVAMNKTLKRHDSDYDDYDVVEQNVSENTRVNYDNQVAVNKTRPPNKEYVKLPHEKKENTFAKHVATKAAAQSNKHDYVNQEAIDKQQVNSPSETRQMNLETSGTDQVAEPTFGSQSQSSYGESNMQSANTNSSGEVHSYENDSLYYQGAGPNQKDERSSREFHSYENDSLYYKGAGPNQKEERKQSSEKPPVPAPRTPNTTAVQKPKPKPLPRQPKQSSDVSVDANRPPKPRSSPVSSLDSQENKSLPKSYTSPLSSLQSFSYREQIFDSSLGSFVDVDATPKTLDSQSSLTKASTASAATSETTHGRNNINSPPPRNSPATNPRSTNNIFVPGISGPSSLSNESPRRRSNAMCRVKSFDSPTTPTCPTIRLQGAMSNRPYNLSVHPDQSRERSNSHSDLDTNPEKRKQSRSKQAVSQKAVGTVYSQTQEPDTPAAVFGTWTCTYCTNIVFHGSVCDVCGNKRKESTGILV